MKWLVILLLAIFLTLGCTQQIQNFNNTVQQSNNETSLQDYLNNAKIKSNYTVHESHSWSSSGGDRNLNIIYAVQNEEFISCSGNYYFSGSDSKSEECNLEALNNSESPFRAHISLMTMSDISNGLFDFNTSKLLKLQDRDCLYNIYLNQKDILVCFNNESYIVNYAYSQPPINKFYWSIEGYDFTPQISNLIK